VRRWGFRAGLADTVDWYLHHPEWWGSVRGGQEFQQLQKDWYLARQV
jgi:dTDP-D-glucose 4,6-dehydratase